MAFIVVGVIKLFDTNSPDGVIFGSGITLKCPPDWTVVLHGTPIMGGFTDKTTPPPLNNGKRLILRGHAIMGGVEVRN